MDLLHIIARAPDNLLEVREKPNDLDASIVNCRYQQTKIRMLSLSFTTAPPLHPSNGIVRECKRIVRFLSTTSTRALHIVYHGTQRCPVSDFFFRSHSNTTTAKTLDTPSLTSFFDHTTHSASKFINMAQNTGASPTIFVVDYTTQGPRPMSEEYENDDQCLVEALLATRRRRGVLQYLVSWQGDWPAEEKESWEPKGNVSDEILQDLKSSGIVLPTRPDDDEWRTEPEDDGKMDLDDDSDSEYDPDEYDDDDEMDMSDYEVDRSRKTKLPKKSSVMSPPTSGLHSDDSRSPVAVAQAEETDEMYSQPAASPAQPSSASSPGGNNGEFTQPAPSPAQPSFSSPAAGGSNGMFTQPAFSPAQPPSAPTSTRNNGQYTHAQRADALRAQAQLRAELQAEDVLWEIHGNQISFGVPETLRQTPATMQPAFQQFIQAPTVSQSGFFGFGFDPMMPPAAQQPSQAPAVSQPGFVDFASDPVLFTADDDAFLNEIFDFKAAAEGGDGDSDEDAEGSEISEGEQARYAAHSIFSRM